MKSGEKKFVDRLKDLELTPAADSFDLIYESYNKPERKKGWTLIGLIIGSIAAVGIFIISSQNHSINKVQHSKKSTITLKSESVKAELISDKVPNDNDTTKELSQPILNLAKKQKGHVLNAKLKASARPRTSPNLGAITKNKLAALEPADTDSYGYSDKRILPIINEEEKRNSLDELLWDLHQNTSATISEDGLGPMAIPRLTLLLPRTDQDIFFELMVKPIFRPIKPRSNFTEHFSLGIIAESGQQHFCSFAKAKQKRWGISLSKSISHRLSFLASYARSSVAYSFAYTDELKARFGHTDKYPVLVVISDRTESLDNSLKYSSIDLGIQVKLLELGQHSLSLILTQEFVLTQNQEFIYSLTNQKNYSYLKTSKDFQVHQIRPSLLYTYQLANQIQLAAKLSYNYSLNFIGLEKEKYSGYNIGLGVTYVY